MCGLESCGDFPVFYLSQRISCMYSWCDCWPKCSSYWPNDEQLTHVRLSFLEIWILVGRSKSGWSWLTPASATWKTSSGPCFLIPNLVELSDFSSSESWLFSFSFDSVTSFQWTNPINSVRCTVSVVFYLRALTDPPASRVGLFCPNIQWFLMTW